MASLSTAVAAFHLIKTAGLVANQVSFPVLRRGSTTGKGPSTSLLVPARDEADNLHRTLLTWLKQPADEILVLDDDSGDDTAAIVAGMARHDSRLRLITGTPRPPGWIGKNWACHQLAQAATGDLLLFCDADVTLRAGALPAVWAQIDAQQADVFSVFPRQHADGIGERMLVPLIDETLLAFLPYQLLDLPIPAAAVANGQLLAFTRDAYTALGGHAAVAEEIVEDIALARAARRAGLKLGLALGGDLISTRMYSGYTQTVRGLGKSIRSAHHDSDLLLWAGALTHLTLYTWPWLRLRHGAGWKAAAVLSMAQRILTNAKTGRGSYAEALLVPAIAPAALPVYRQGLRKVARWKGRDYP